jgi:hypothetical protein
MQKINAECKDCFKVCKTRAFPSAAGISDALTSSNELIVAGQNNMALILISVNCWRIEKQWEG